MSNEKQENQDQPFTQYEEVEKGLGMIWHAMSQSPLYAGKTLAEAYKTVLPALLTRQFKVVRNERGESAAYISWAMIGEEAESRIASGEAIKLSDWQSGETGLLIDVAAKNGAACNVLAAKLKQELFSGKVLKAIRVQDGKAELTEVAEAKAAAN